MHIQLSQIINFVMTNRNTFKLKYSICYMMNEDEAANKIFNLYTNANCWFNTKLN